MVVQAGAEVNAGTDQKWTCLHLAAKEQNTGVVRVLLENNADGALRDTYGATALHYAVQLADLAHFQALHTSPRCVVKTPDKKGARSALKEPLFVHLSTNLWSSKKDACFGESETETMGMGGSNVTLSPLVLVFWYATNET